METTPVTEVPKKNQAPLMIAISAIVLCCCCAVLAVAGYYGYVTLQSPVADLGIGEAPVGGLGNDVLRNDTWQYVAAAAMGQGCDQPIGDETTIEVLQEPQNGVWLEKWTVACASGDTYAYEIEFILDDSGATFNIKSIP